MLTTQWLAHSQVFLGAGAEAPTHDPSEGTDGQGSSAPPASRRPPSSGSSSGPSSGPHALPDTAQQTAQDHARHWLQGVVHDSEAEEAATQEIEATGPMHRSSVAFLRNEESHHL